MEKYFEPAPLVDLAAWPPVIRTSETGSFAKNTLAVRVPKIAADTIERNHFSPAIAEAMRALREEILAGTVRPLFEDAPDRDFWNGVSAPNLGRSWLDVPWYWAEAYFYRRVLEATGYFRPGSMQGFDPFAVTKNAEWEPDVAPAAVNGLLAALPEEKAARFAALLHGSLWGNRIDLSYTVAVQTARDTGGAPHAAGDAANLLVDDTEAAWEWLNRAAGKVILIADNSGTELAMDLGLLDGLLGSGLAAEAEIHVKGQPFFVSDAMAADVEAGLAALARGPERPAGLAQRIRGYRQEGRLALRSHWFYATNLFYYQLPRDLIAGLASARLVIVKGDANYRRLLGDAHWPADAPFRDIMRYFPAPVLALRTFKAELVVGLRPGLADTLAQEDPDWLVNGKRGVIQGRLP